MSKIHLKNFVSLPTGASEIIKEKVGKVQEEFLKEENHTWVLQTLRTH